MAKAKYFFKIKNALQKILTYLHQMKNFASVQNGIAQLL
jgi:hypothetical protein